jgi:transposase
VVTVNGVNHSTQIIKGTCYVYEDQPYWDKDMKANRHKRAYIGKLGSAGEFIPNKIYLARQNKTVAEGTTAVPAMASRMYCGATYLLDEIGRIAGIEDDLRAAFPNNYKELMALAYYLVCESDSPMYRFGTWARNHRHPLGDDSLSSQSISSLLPTISESGKMEYFRRQALRRLETEYLAYDTTSISSYSEFIKAVRFGKNKDHDKLKQINLALVFGEQSGLPAYYRILPGNISDVATINKLILDMRFLNLSKIKLVMDRGFFSAANVNALYNDHFKFLLGVKMNNKLIPPVFEKAKETIHTFANFDNVHNVYCYSSTEKWEYEQNGNVSKIDRRIYVHIYYDGVSAEEERLDFSKSLAEAETAILAGNTLTNNQESLVKNYFTTKNTPKRGVSVSYNTIQIKQHMDEMGYFALASNEIKDPREAIEIYRRKDVVEKAFDNLKDRLQLKRTEVHSDRALAGSVFLQFLALVYISYIHIRMRQFDLYKTYTMQSMLDFLDVIERYEYEGQKTNYSEITAKQIKLYACFGINPPNTL